KRRIAALPVFGELAAVRWRNQCQRLEPAAKRTTKPLQEASFDVLECRVDEDGIELAILFPCQCGERVRRVGPRDVAAMRLDGTGDHLGLDMIGRDDADPLAAQQR